MRKTKIVLWSVITALLILFLIVLLLLPQQQTSSLFGTIYRYGDSEGYTAGGGSLSAEGVNTLSVDWLNGSVELLPSFDGLFHIEESASRECDEKEKVHTRISGETLSVRYAESGTSILNLTKKLTLRVPSGLLLSALDVNTVSASLLSDDIDSRSATIETVSGNIRIDGGAFTTLSLNTVSGACLAEGSRAETLSIESTSGSIRFSGEADDITLDTVSGRLEAELPSRAPQTIRASSTSGDITLFLPAPVGYTVSFSSVSGDFTSEVGVTKSGSTYVAGDGAVNIRSNTVSGDLKICKK